MHTTLNASSYLLLAACVTCFATPAAAQSEAGQRQAAAEAYDKGTAAYLAGDFDEAAEWFETANRLSPAAPALIQAARAQKQAGNTARAATLGLRLTLEYGSEQAAVEFGQALVEEFAPQFLRIDAACDGCKLDVDGALQDSLSVYVEPGAHTVTATFETGERREQVEGAAGEARVLQFDTPPPRDDEPEQPWQPPATSTGTDETSKKPLAPVVTFVSAGITGALLIGSVVSTLDMKAGVDPYETAAEEHETCVDRMGEDACMDLYVAAKKKLDAGRGKETRSTVLWAATAGAAAITGVFAIFLTDWSGGSDEPEEASPEFGVSVDPERADLRIRLKGRF